MAATTFEMNKEDRNMKFWFSSEELKDIPYPQNTNAFLYELHDGHSTGNPIYIRIDPRDKSSIPKFDTRNKSPKDYSKISDFANSSKLRVLKNKDQEKLLKMVQDDWAYFAQIGKDYYGN